MLHQAAMAVVVLVPVPHIIYVMLLKVTMVQLA
jgi:hypothetical protein